MTDWIVSARTLMLMVVGSSGVGNVVWEAVGVVDASGSSVSASAGVVVGVVGVLNEYHLKSK